MSVSSRVLFVEFGIGCTLIAGAVLARRRLYRAHAVCQTAAVLLNLVMIVRFMANPFFQAVAPAIPARLGRTYYAVASAHGMVGLFTECLAIYVLLAAGTPVLPVRWRFTDYRRWMRATLLLWWLTLALGAATYFRWHPGTH
jgi:uncharacterized membrane protein YozB (DUF420 family)